MDTRSEEPGKHSVSDFLENLRERAREFGTRREQLLIKAADALREIATEIDPRHPHD